MTLTEENQRVLILHAGGTADDETARQAEQLLAENAEAKEFASEIRRVTSALRPTATEQTPLSDEELRPWLRLARARFGDEAGHPALAHSHWLSRKSFWITSAIAASLLVAIGVWRLQPSIAPVPKPAGPIGRLWQLPKGGHLTIRDVLTQELRGDETITLDEDRPGRIELPGAVAWLTAGSVFSLSDSGATIELRTGRIVLEVPAGNRTWRVRANSIEADFQTGILEATASTKPFIWACYRGEARLHLQTGDRVLRAGEEFLIIDQEGRQIEVQPVRRKEGPGWIRFPGQTFKHLVTDAQKDSPSR